MWRTRCSSFNKSYFGVWWTEDGKSPLTNVISDVLTLLHNFYFFFVFLFSSCIRRNRKEVIFLSNLL